MLRASLAAVTVLTLRVWAQDMPVTKLAGGGAGQGVSQPPALQQPPRPAGSQLPPLAVTQIDPRDTTLDSPRRLSLTFAEPRPIDEVLALLVEGTPFSLSIDPAAKGAFRGELKNLTIREALTTLLTPLGLDFDVRGTVIVVVPHQVETRLYDLNMLNVQRGLQRTAGATDAGGSVTLASTVNADDVFTSIADGVQTLLSDGGRVHIDRRQGLAQVTDFPERLDRVGLYIETLHERSGRQVRLQARAFEVTLKEAASIDWRLVRETLGLPRDAPEAGVAADPLALRNALAAQGEIRDLWAPDVTTLNNEPAMVRMSTPGSSSLTMTVVPQISADGIVQLSVSHAWEEHAGDQKQGFLKSTPLTRTSQAETVTRVMDGNTVMVSGLTRPAPFATTATGIMGVFGAQQKQTGHAELVVLLKPTVVTPGTFSAASR